MKFLNIVLAVLVVLAPSRAASATFEDLNGLIDEFDKVSDAILSSQIQTVPAENDPISEKSLAYDYLTACGDRLTFVSREIRFTVRLSKMAQLVSQPTAREIAQAQIDIQTQSLVGSAGDSVKFLDAMIPSIRDQKVKSSCVRSRELINSGFQLASKLTPLWPLPSR